MDILKRIYCWIIDNVVTVIFGGVLVFYLVSVGIFVLQNPQYLGWGVLIGLVLAVFYVVMYLILTKLLAMRELYVKIGIVAMSLVIYLVWNLLARTMPVSDYSVLLDGAKAMAEGRFAELSFNPENYFYFYNFQTGYVMFLAFLTKVLGGSLASLKNIEAVVLALSNLMVYLIAKKIWTAKAGIITALLYSTLLFNIAGASIINNQHIAMLMILMAIYLLVRDGGWKTKVFCGICLAMSYILRPSSVIFVVAVAAFGIWKMLANNFRNWQKISISLVVILGVTVLGLKAYDFAAQSFRIVPHSALSGNLKDFKFLLGLQSEGITGARTTDAEKTQVYYDLKAYDFDYEKYNTATREYVKDKYLNDTRTTLKHLLDKMYVFTAYPDNQVDFALNERTDGKLAKLIRYGGYIQYVGLLMLTFGGVIVISRWKMKNWTKIRIKADAENATLAMPKEAWAVFLMICFVGYFLCYILIETQTRYRYDQYMLLCLLASPVLAKLFGKLDKRFFDRSGV